MTPNRSTPDRRHTITVSIHGIDLTLESAPELFSPRGLDRGTAAMLSQVEFHPDDKVLDLGCGYGLVGILAAKLIGPERVVMTDVDPRAVELSQINAQTNSVSEVTILHSNAFRDHTKTDFSLILSNPPYHHDFSVPKEFILKGFNRLRIGGKLVMVTKRRNWYRNKLANVFGGVKVTEIDDYFVFTAEKRREHYANARRR